MENKQFYRTVIRVEVLSEEPLLDPGNLHSLYYDITEGSCSGSIQVEDTETVSAKRMAELLESQGSEPGFFQLGDDGEDLSEL